MTETRYTLGCQCSACGSLDTRAEKGKIVCDKCSTVHGIEVVMAQTVNQEKQHGRDESRARSAA